MESADPQSGALRAKIVTMVSLFVISMAVGCLPMLLSLKFNWFKNSGTDMRSSNKVVVGLLGFGGGVLFATSFMHLLPEVDENIQLLQASGELAKLPIYLGGLIMCCGFFMMYLIEELVHLYISRRGNRAEARLGRALSLRKSSTEASEQQDRLQELEGGKVQALEQTNHSHGHGHSHFAIPAEEGIMSALRGLLIVLALSIHELFEGLAVGLESSTANVWYMFAAVSAHKYIMAFCIGVELLAAGTRRWLSLVYLFVFSFGSALGIGVGALLVGGAGAADAGILSVVLQGLACGTLVYVVFFEVWRRERSGAADFWCALSGFTVMVALQLIVDIVVM